MKVLVISHNSIATYNSMGKTLLAFLQEFRKEELCQLYIYPTIPNVAACNSYFRITDKEILRNCFMAYPVGRRITEQEILNGNNKIFENLNDEKLYRNHKNKRPVRILARDFLWKRSRWYNSELRRWIEEEKPTCLFVAPGMAKFLYDIALKIADDYRLPMVAYICDEYYFSRKASTILGRLTQKLLRRKMERFFEKTSHIVAIDDELADTYGERFQCPATKIMTGSTWEICSSPRDVTQPHCLVYMGNVRLNRFTSLCDIGLILDDFNRRKDGESFTLHIYTGEKNKEILGALRKPKSIRLHDFVSGEEFEKVFHEADLLLHVEAFDEISVDRTKNSISTKIADCLGSGRCLLGYGPDNIASMRHLMKNHCAIVATSKEELPRALQEAFYDREKREVVIQNALDCARRFHHAPTNSARLYEIIKNI